MKIAVRRQLSPAPASIAFAFAILFVWELGEANAQLPSRAEPADSAERVETGELSGKDKVLGSGEFYDAYRFDAAAGDTWAIDLHSDDFDTYLIINGVDDASFSLQNDDHGGDVHHSRILMQAPRDGAYEVVVTSFEPGETGGYRLTIEKVPPPSAESGHREERGELADGDETLDGGEFYDLYTVTLAAGATARIRLDSTDFDPYLLVRRSGDAEFQVEDDDGGGGHNALVTLNAAVAGIYEIHVTSYEADETGSYRLVIDSNGGSGAVLLEEIGALEKGDEKLEDGEFVDTHEFEVTAGESYLIDLFSEEFDTYLLVRGGKSGLEADNDDFEGSTNHSQVRFTASEAETCTVSVTSFSAGETGEYRLTIRSGVGAGLDSPPPRRETGELARGDQTLDSGEFLDSYEFEGLSGQHVRIELRSDEFDTYLILQEPGGDTHDNDDFRGRQNTSVIEMDLDESGTYQVVVTSYKKGETGAYELSINFGHAASPGSILAGEFTELNVDGVFPGTLDAADPLRDGRHVEGYAVSLSAGVRSIIRMESDDFDTLLVLTYPDGTEVEFDDDFSNLNAAIDLIPEESGVYGVTATSFSDETTGDYTLHVTLAAPGRPVGQRGNVPVSPGHRILGVFVGISDYDGEDDLEFCDRDARLFHDILQREFNMQSADSVLLLNEEATIDRVTEALAQIGERAGPNDLLIFFYSGHGDQVSGAEDAFDPDGIHETLSLYDGDLKDDDLAALINRSAAGISLVALDSCFSGGFAKDVVSTRGRMGVFSSEEDVLSLVPERFRAGGYLSRFLAEAVSERRHDSDLNDDGRLTSHELSHFLQERYLQEVRSTKERQKSSDEFVNPESNLSYQRLVVDRGGLGHEQVLFRWE